jgi:O-antigen ligase
MLSSKIRWERWLCAGCLGVTLVAVTLGASRGGFLGLVASLIFVVWHSRQRLRNLVVAGGLVLPLSLLMPISPLARLLHPNNGDTIAQQARTSLWQAGLHMMESYPVTGVGLGNFKPLVPEYSDLPTPPDYIAHSAYIEIGSEMGVPALLIFLGILISSFETLNSIRKLTPRPGLHFVREAALSLQAGLLGSAVAIVFVSGQYQKMLWLIIFLSMCMPAITRKHLRFLSEDKLKP